MNMHELQREYAKLIQTELDLNNIKYRDSSLHDNHNTYTNNTLEALRKYIHIRRIKDILNAFKNRIYTLKCENSLLRKNRYIIGPQILLYE